MQDSAGNRGFTLLEVLIVAAILGILASFAFPAYQNSVIRSRRAEGQAVLLQVASDQERFYSSNNSYSTYAQPLVSPVIASRDSENGHYTVTVAACGTGTIATCFTATATPQGVQTADDCTTLTISDTLHKGSTGSFPDECWN